MLAEILDLMVCLKLLYVYIYNTLSNILLGKLEIQLVVARNIGNPGGKNSETWLQLQEWLNDINLVAVHDRRNCRVSFGVLTCGKARLIMKAYSLLTMVKLSRLVIMQAHVMHASSAMQKASLLVN